MKAEKTQEEILNILISLTGKTIGEKAVNQVLSKASNNVENEDDIKELVFKFADEIQNLYGKNGSFAIVRQLGREVAKTFMEQHHKEEWENLLEEGLRILGFAQGIEKSNNTACICNCIFFEKELEPRNIEPINHSVCRFGLGFIEGFIKEIISCAKGVKWISRDYNSKRCLFEFLN